MFYLNSTLNFGIPPLLVFQLEVYYKVERLLTGLTAKWKGRTARWYSNKTSLNTLCAKDAIKFYVVPFELSSYPSALEQLSFSSSQDHRFHHLLVLNMHLIKDNHK